MAIKIYSDKKPLSDVIHGWMSQAEAELRSNLRIQRIYPQEIYKGWLKENERRKAYAKSHPGKDVWYSTGKSADSVYTSVVRASGPSNITVGISHIDYLRFADMGVGIWGDYEDISRNKKARPNARYLSRWVPASGQTHRPGIMFKARTIQRRMENYLMDFYGLEIEARFIDGFTYAKKPFTIF